MSDHQAEAAPGGAVAAVDQARRLLNDIASFRGYLEHKTGQPVSQRICPAIT